MVNVRDTSLLSWSLHSSRERQKANNIQTEEISVKEINRVLRQMIKHQDSQCYYVMPLRRDMKHI